MIIDKLKYLNITSNRIIYMNGIECLSISAAIITIMHFTKECFLSCDSDNDDDKSTYTRLFCM